MKWKAVAAEALQTAAQAIMLIVTSASLVGSCKQPEPSPAERPAEARAEDSQEVVQLVTVVVEHEGEGAGAIEEHQPKAAMERALVGQLTASGAFVEADQPIPEGRDPVRARLRLEVGAQVIDTGHHERSLLVSAFGEVDWTRGNRLVPTAKFLVERPLVGALSGDVGGDHAIEAAALGKTLDQTLAHALDLVAKELVAKEQLRQGPAPGIVAALEGPQDEMAVWALELVASREVRAGLEPAIALLDATEERVRAAALRALVALRDPRAVEPLARHAQFQDYERMREVIEAVSVIGGDEAETFLELVASGHSDPDMRERAHAALARMHLPVAPSP